MDRQFEMNFRTATRYAVVSEARQKLKQTISAKYLSWEIYDNSGLRKTDTSSKIESQHARIECFNQGFTDKMTSNRNRCGSTTTSAAFDHSLSHFHGDLSSPDAPEVSGFIRKHRGDVETSSQIVNRKHCPHPPLNSFKRLWKFEKYHGNKIINMENDSIRYSWRIDTSWRKFVYGSN